MIKTKSRGENQSPTPTAAVSIGVTFNGCTSALPSILHRCKDNQNIDMSYKEIVK